MHHPSQCMHPEWDCAFDHDGATAKRTRLAFLERFGSGAVRVIGTHFGAPTATRIVPNGEPMEGRRARIARQAAG